jgi:hypothetical protein
MYVLGQGRTNPKRRFALAIKFLFLALMSGDCQRRTCFLPLFWRQEFEAALTFFFFWKIWVTLPYGKRK